MGMVVLMRVVVVVVVVMGMTMRMAVRMPTPHLVIGARLGVEGGVVVLERRAQQLGQLFENVVGWEAYPATFRVFTQCELHMAVAEVVRQPCQG